ncbi:FMN-dependent NADH-azoreductase [Granulicella sp. S190]|uniref:FMN-dependent NADH-azoreductase n=1 Tax=Granulicella sp. S190 TaxID=1747226 RepID=UPI00131D5616|nr:NAD(P)H-dependent oxidoreductase [Granulicella sp. S190]
MPTLLVLNSSPFVETSVSRGLTSEYVESWKTANPSGTVVFRDLTASSLKTIDAAWVGAAYTSKDARTAEQKEALATSETLLAELRAADEYVLGVPMHNFSVPAVLKLWIDQIARVNETFSYADGSPKGLLAGKKATFLVASGGAYDAGTVMASYNFVEPYLRTVFGFLGVTDTNFLSAGGASALMYGKIDRATFLQPHFETIRSQFVTA